MKSRALGVSRIERIHIGESVATVVADLGQPEDKQQGKYDGPDGEPCTWYNFSKPGVNLSVAFGQAGIVVQAFEDIKFKQYENGGSDAAFFMLTDDGLDQKIFVKGTPYDMSGREIDPKRFIR